MARKNSGENGTEKKTVHVVAQGHAFTNKGVMYREGDEITAAAFASEDAFKKVVASGAIIAQEVEAEKTAENPPADGAKDGKDDDGGKTPGSGGADGGNAGGEN